MKRFNAYKAEQTVTKIPSRQKQRHRARRLAMQALYQWNYNHISVEEIIINMLEEQNVAKFDREYFHILVNGTVKNVEEINAALEPLLDRKLSELNPVELAILRVSAFEMIHQISTPYRVVINEGVELAKEFGAQEGHKYVNAVLDKLAHQHRVAEIK